MSRNGADDYDAIAKICVDWWRDLRSLNAAGKPIVFKNGGEKAPDRAALAELRRIGVIDFGGIPAVDSVSALGISAFRHLIRRLRDAQPGNYRVQRWLGIAEEGNGKLKDREFSPFAIAAATLARIRTDVGDRKRGATAKLLGAGEDDNPLFAEARFKRLIRTRNDWPGLSAQARRIAAILGREAPVGDLGASLILWDADQRITRDWAFQYYQGEFAAPEREVENPATSPSS